MYIGHFDLQWTSPPPSQAWHTSVSPSFVPVKGWFIKHPPAPVQYIQRNPMGPPPKAPTPDPLLGDNRPWEEFVADFPFMRSWGEFYQSFPCICGKVEDSTTWEVCECMLDEPLPAAAAETAADELLQHEMQQLKLDKRQLQSEQKKQQPQGPSEEQQRRREVLETLNMVRDLPTQQQLAEHYQRFLRAVERAEFGADNSYLQHRLQLAYEQLQRDLHHQRAQQELRDELQLNHQQQLQRDRRSAEWEKGRREREEAMKKEKRQEKKKESQEQQQWRGAGRFVSDDEWRHYLSCKENK